ncbi:MAG: hypothetical protein PWP54_154 [Thermosipho sp. (in: thermotogales)]|nr:hypothetical protein [Thermosipho sp. (in: thermotogales)]MDN5324571.1 hypothetical protein [Thermosipho sp. (in: thermotogales)]
MLLFLQVLAFSELDNYLEFSLIPQVVIAPEFSDYMNIFVGVNPINPAERIFYLQDFTKPFGNIIFNFENENIKFHFEYPIQYDLSGKIKYITNIIGFDLDTLYYYLDPSLPLFSFLSLKGENFEITTGRFPLKWGYAKYPVTISPTTFQDNVNLVFYFPKTKYYFIAISSYPGFTAEEKNLFGNGLEDIKTIFGHRIEFDFDRINFSLGELNVIGGRTPDIIDIGPVVIYHHNFRNNSNVVGMLDFEVNLNDNFSTYGELSVDDIVLPEEAGGNSRPFAYAYVFGFKYSLGKDFVLKGEYNFVNEWMYTTYDSPYMTVNVRHLFATKDGRFFADYPLGFIYGPDATMLTFSFEAKISDVFLALEYNHLTKGTVIEDGYERWRWFWDGWTSNIESLPVKGQDKKYHIFTISSNYSFYNIYLKFINFAKIYLGIFLKFDWKINF